MSASVVISLTSLARRNSQVAHPDLRRPGRFSADSRRTPHATRLSGLAGVQRTSDNTNLRAGFEIGRRTGIRGDGFVAKPFDRTRVADLRKALSVYYLRRAVSGGEHIRKNFLRNFGADFASVDEFD